MYVTRIVKVSQFYFVEYKWDGNLWRSLLALGPLTWTRYSHVPDLTIEEARETRDKALESYELNYRWNTQVVE